MKFHRKICHRGCYWLLCVALFWSDAGLAQAAIGSLIASPSLEQIEALYGKAGSGQFVALWPVIGASRISSPFGMRKHPIKGTKAFHHGIDIAAPQGAAIAAVAAGRVQFAGWRGGFGRIVEIEHSNGWVSRYAHAKSLSVQTGDTVAAGQIIAKVGCSGHATGAHLHLEIEHLGRKLDPEVFWGKVAQLSPR